MGGLEETTNAAQDVVNDKWEDLASDARDHLRLVSRYAASATVCPLSLIAPFGFQLYLKQGYEDEALLDHVQQLVGELDAVGVKPSAPEDGAGLGDTDGDEDEWTDSDGGGEGHDIEMAQVS